MAERTRSAIDMYCGTCDEPILPDENVVWETKRGKTRADVEHASRVEQRPYLLTHRECA